MLKKLWNDQVWSKVIAGLILAGLAIFGTYVLKLWPTWDSPASRLAKVCKQSTTGLKQPPELVIQIWYGVVQRLKKERLPPEHDLLNLYSLKLRIRDQVNDPKDLVVEAHYTLKCMEEAGELRLEESGPIKRYWGLDFPNQRIVFRSQ